jgi:hypothetical protein
VVVLSTTMAFVTDINFKEESFVLAFVRDDMRLELQPSDPELIKVPIEDTGYIRFGYPNLGLEWNNTTFEFMFGDTSDPQGGALSFYVPMTAGLMASFKMAVEMWNIKVEEYQDLQNKKGEYDDY